MIESRKMKESECRDLDCTNARFGSAVANIGDIDLDGFQGRLLHQWQFSCKRFSHQYAQAQGKNKQHCSDNVSMHTDLAVGAPYEGTGAVYIFRGSAKGIHKMHSQRIAATDLLSARPLASFGASLSGGLDVDKNG